MQSLFFFLLYSAIFIFSYVQYRENRDESKGLAGSYLLCMAISLISIFFIAMKLKNVF